MAPDRYHDQRERERERKNTFRVANHAKHTCSTRSIAIESIDPRESCSNRFTLESYSFLARYSSSANLVAMEEATEGHVRRAYATSEKWKSTKEEIPVSRPASASTWRIAGWQQLGSHRHFDFAFLGAFARLGAPLLPSSSHLNATSDPTDGGETRPRTLPSAAPPCFFALSKPGSAPLSLSFSLFSFFCLTRAFPSVGRYILRVKRGN